MTKERVCANNPDLSGAIMHAFFLASQSLTAIEATQSLLDHSCNENEAQYVLETARPQIMELKSLLEEMI